MEKGAEILRRGTIKSQDALRGLKAEEGPGWPVEPQRPAGWQGRARKCLSPAPNFLKWQARVCLLLVGGNN